MARFFENLIARGTFPLAIVGCMTAAIVQMRAGVAVEVATSTTILGAYVFLATLERFFPLHPEWSISHGDGRADLGLGLTNAALTFAVQPVLLGLGAGVAGWLAVHFGGSLWPDSWPLALQLIPALLLAELFEYTCHRAMHEVPWLWRIHAPHHSATRLYWFNALRFHPLDTLLVGPGKLIPLVALGAGEQLLALVIVFAAVHGSCQHANIPCRIGPLNWVFSMAELHRWHHSPIAAEANHNYGGNLIVWDIVFGTRWLPEGREPPVRTGIEELPSFPRSYRALMGAPFRWREILREGGR